MEGLQQQFNKTIVNSLKQKLDTKNVMAVPRLVKVVVNMGVKDAIADKKNMERAAKALGIITGQKPKAVKAKKSIASFKLREGDEIGLVVTLRGKRMYAFVDRLIKIVLPRLRDFHGVSRKSFDGRGNYTLGFSEYAVFPEIDPSSVDRMQGMEIIFVTTAKDNKDGVVLLEALGMPFTKEGERSSLYRS